jgi:hypothetical protein
MSLSTERAMLELAAAVAAVERQHADYRRHIACLEQQVEQLREDEELLDLLLLWFMGTVDGPKRSASINRINQLIEQRKGATSGTK